MSLTSTDVWLMLPDLSGAADRVVVAVAAPTPTAAIAVSFWISSRRLTVPRSNPETSASITGSMQRLQAGARSL